MIEALLFDCDGVLVDSEPLHHRCWSQTFAEQLGAPLAGPASQIVGLDLERIVQLGLVACGRAAEPASPGLCAALLAHKTALFLARAPAELRPLSGVEALLGEARGRRWPVGVVSAALRPRLLRTLELIGLSEGWGCILSGEDMLAGERPRKDWRRAARALGAPLARCAVLEDSAEGIAEARRQGAGLVVGLTTTHPAALLLAAGAHRAVADLAGLALAGPEGGAP